MLPSTRPATISAFTRYPRRDKGSSFRLLLCAELLHLGAVDDSTGAERLAVELRNELRVLYPDVEHAVIRPPEDLVEIDGNERAIRVIALHLAEVLDEVLPGGAVHSRGVDPTDERISRQPPDVRNLACCVLAERIHSGLVVGERRRVELERLELDAKVRALDSRNRERAIVVAAGEDHSLHVDPRLLQR